MNVQETKIKDCYIIEPQVFKDTRGYFMESFNSQLFRDKTGLHVNFVQDNESQSAHGVIRGLHAQQGVHAQAKLIRVIQGDVLDVVVDFRPDSATFLKHIALKISAENKKQLFVPRGCLHGFSVLSESAIFFYKCDNYYKKESEIGLRYDDPEFNIDWQVAKDQNVISPRDLGLPYYKDLKK